MQHFTIRLLDCHLPSQPKISTISIYTEECCARENSQKDSRIDLLVIFNSKSLIGIEGLLAKYFKFNNFGLLNISGMHSCCQHKVESFSSSAIVDLLRAVWNSLQRLLCCCSCVKIDLHAHSSCSITQFLCTTDTWVLNPKSNNFGQNSRIDLLVIFNSSYCRLVGQLLLVLFFNNFGLLNESGKL